MKKLILILLILIYAIQAHAATDQYKSESMDIKVSGKDATVFSGNTLLYKNNIKNFSVKNLFDGNKSTAWVTKFDENMNLLKIIFKKPIYVESISIKNGYQKSKNIFKANRRVKVLNITKVIVGGPSYPLESEITLKDNMNEQTFSLQKGWTDSINLFKTKKLIFNVSEIYNGDEYKDLCLSELKLKYSSSIAYKPSISWLQLKRLIDKNKIKNNNGWDWTGLNDNNYKFFNDLLFYVLNNDHEAYQYFQSYNPEGVANSEAMEFLYKNAVKDSLKQYKLKKAQPCTPPDHSRAPTSRGHGR